MLRQTFKKCIIADNISIRNADHDRVPVVTRKCRYIAYFAVLFFLGDDFFYVFLVLWEFIFFFVQLDIDPEI